MAKFTPEQEEQIEFLRKHGHGYRLIAAELGLDRDAVRYYCKTHNLAGIAKENHVQIAGIHCRQCGAKLTQAHTGRKRIFCSQKCKDIWWKINGHLVPRPMGSREIIQCAYCGKQITAYKGKQRRYCSYECYIRDRFWRAEDGREPYVPPSKH